MAQLQHVFGLREVTQVVGAKVGQPGARREQVADQHLGDAREHHLPPVRQLAQSRSSVDRRPDVIAFVAKLYLAGVNADPQPNRFQWRALQVERACHCVAGPRERDDEAVPLALLDRSHATMGADELA